MRHRLAPLLAAATLFAVISCTSDDPVAPVTVPETPAPVTPADPNLPAAGPTVVRTVIALPVRPEAVALGTGTTFFAGSSSASTDTTNHGMIVRGDLATGIVATLVPGVRAKATSGLAYDARANLLWATETRGGAASVYNATTGALVQRFVFPVNPAPGNQINDVALASSAAYFTNSFQRVIYRVAIDATGNPAPDFTTITLNGDYVHHASARPFNINNNGIAVTADGRYVIVGNMGGDKGVASANCIVSPRAPADSGCVSQILRVDPATGDARLINLLGTKVYFVDGVRLDGQTLYLAQNFMDKISVFTLSADFLTATFVKNITSPNWIVPSSMFVFENSVFAVNAGFGPGPYQLSRMPK